MTEDDPKEKNPEGEPIPPPEGEGQTPAVSDIDILSSKVAELENSLTQYKNQLLRKAAEFENYKKRTEADYASLVKFANEDLILKLLPVIDDLERSLKARKESTRASGENESVFIQGLELIYTKFRKILDSQGLQHFDVVGTAFDPHLHDALMQVPRSDFPPHTVIEEIEKGFTLHGKVIRHAKVVVSADSVGVERPDDKRNGESDETGR